MCASVLAVYDVTRPETFQHLSQWLEEANMYCPGGGKGVVKLLVGNKIDLDDARAVSAGDGEAWARSNGMLFIEASAKTKEGIAQVFQELVAKVLENPTLLAATAPTTARRGGDRVDVGGGGGGGDGSVGGSCC
jgi:Ras-related protein Rab-18